MPHLVHGQTVPRFPGFGNDAGNAIFGRQRRIAVDEGVDSVGVGPEHGLSARAGGGTIGAGGVFEAEATHLHILAYGRGAGGLGPTTNGAAPVVFHRPQPVLGGHEPLGEPGVALSGGADVGNAPLVAPDRHGSVQSGYQYFTVQGWHRVAEVGSSDGYIGGGVNGHRGHPW